MSWPSQLLSEKMDEKGAHFGCKSNTLESVDMILPMIKLPDMIWGRNVILMIDNIVVMLADTTTAM